MNWIKNLYTHTEEVLEDMPDNHSRNTQVAGVIMIGYMVASMSYFVVKGARVVISKIVND